MEHLIHRDGRAFTVNTLTLTKEDFISIVEEAVALSDTTGLYVVFDIGGCRVVVDKNTDPNDTATKWWNGPRIGRGNHIGVSCTIAYDTNDNARDLRLREAPKMTMTFVDDDGWANLKKTNLLFRSTVELAERWARLMQLRMSQGGGLLTRTIAHEALYEADAYGRIQEYRTEEVRNAVLSLLRHHWIHGEALPRVF